MSSKKVIHSPEAPPPVGPYSQAMEAGPFVFCSGQIALNAKGELVSEDVRAQAEQVMKNIGCVLRAADLDYGKIVKTTIFLKNMDDFATVNEVYGKYFSSHPPARSTVEVSRLPKNVKVEIEVLAVRG